MSVVVLSVPEISCGHCEDAITAVVRPLSGVQTVAVDIAGKTVTVQAGPGFDAAVTLAAIDAAGYGVTGYHVAGFEDTSARAADQEPRR